MFLKIAKNAKLCYNTKRKTIDDYYHKMDKSPDKERLSGEDPRENAELALSFNKPITKDERRILKGLVFAIYGQDAHLEVIDGKTKQELIIKGNVFELRRVATAFYEREWERDSEMLTKLMAYLKRV